jgi:TolB-like protein/DNA-binding winged helix-turn-helix (wHTH) protein
MPVHFANFTLDESRRQLLAAGEPVHLSPKAFQLLSILIQETPRAISKPDLQERLWPDTFVTEGNLASLVAELRSALGDDAHEPRFIRTLYGFGYSFAAPIADLAPVDSQQVAEFALEPRKRFIGGIRWTSAGIAALLGAAGVVLILSLRSMTGSGATATQFTPIDSLAVLPLANLSGDPQQQYFADGMTEELITQLAQIGALRVISRASVMEYRDTKKNASMIAHELHVRALITGSVLRSATRVRITVQLIDAETGSSIWADQYERELGDILALQNDVARSIEERIRVKITPQEVSRLAAVRSVDPRAYELFLKGRFYAGKNTPDGLNRGLSYFADAARIDSHYAPAFSGIAYCYNEMAFFGILLPPDAYPNARKAAEKALQLDPGTADAHMSLAWEKADFEWDWPSAEREFRTAIRLNPNDAMTRRATARR